MKEIRWFIGKAAIGIWICEIKKIFNAKTQRGKDARILWLAKIFFQNIKNLGLSTLCAFALNNLLTNPPTQPNSARHADKSDGKTQGNIRESY
jgi:hypothetical protein